METARVHVTEAEGISSVTQTSHVRSYPLEGDDPHECGCETEYQAEEPEDIHRDADRVNSRLNFSDPIFCPPTERQFASRAERFPELDPVGGPFAIG